MVIWAEAILPLVLRQRGGTKEETGIAPHYSNVAEKHTSFFSGFWFVIMILSSICHCYPLFTNAFLGFSPSKKVGLLDKLLQDSFGILFKLNSKRSESLNETDWFWGGVQPIAIHYKISRVGPQKMLRRTNPTPKMSERVWFWVWSQCKRDIYRYFCLSSWERQLSSYFNVSTMHLSKLHHFRATHKDLPQLHCKFLVL